MFKKTKMLHEAEIMTIKNNGLSQNTTVRTKTSNIHRSKHRKN